MRKLFTFKMVTILVLILSIGIFAYLIGGGCVVDRDTAQDVLDTQGMVILDTHGYDFLTCGEDDFRNVGVTAKAPGGKIVRVTVCCGMWSKGCTVRK